MYDIIEPIYQLYQEYTMEGEYRTIHNYNSGEQHGASNMTFSVAHVTMTVPRLVLLLTSQVLVHTPVSTIQVQLQQCSRSMVSNWHTPLSSFHHMSCSFPLLWLDTLPLFYS